MNRILTTLLLPALLFSTTVARAQEAEPAEAANPAENAVTLYPEKTFVKKLKMKEGKDAILPYGILNTGNATLVLSGLNMKGKSGSRNDIVISSSKDGSSWERAGIVLQQPPGYTLAMTSIGAVYDSIQKQMVLLYCSMPSMNKYLKAKKKGEDVDLNESDRFFVAVGKGGKFGKPKEITKQFEAKRRGEEDFTMEGRGIQFQGLCLTRGEHRGRLVFLTSIKGRLVCSLYSDDHGRSWKFGAAASISKTNITGHGGGVNLSEAEDGSVVAFLGTEGQKTQWMSSADGGETWEYKSSDPGQGSNPGRWANAFIVLNSKDGSGTGSRLLSVATIENREGKTHVALSYDWGRTWPHQKAIDAPLLVATNNVPVQQIAPGTIGLITTSDYKTFIEDGLKGAGFTTFTISWLTDGKDDGIDKEGDAAGDAPAE